MGNEIVSEDDQAQPTVEIVKPKQGFDTSQLEMVSHTENTERESKDDPSEQVVDSVKLEEDIDTTQMEVVDHTVKTKKDSEDDQSEPVIDSVRLEKDIDTTQLEVVNDAVRTEKESKDDRSEPVVESVKLVEDFDTSKLEITHNTVGNEIVSEDNQSQPAVDIVKPKQGLDTSQLEMVSHTENTEAESKDHQSEPAVDSVRLEQDIDTTQKEMVDHTVKTEKDFENDQSEPAVDSVKLEQDIDTTRLEVVHDEPRTQKESQSAPMSKSKSDSFVAANSSKHTELATKVLRKDDNQRESKSFHGSQNFVSTTVTRLDSTSLTKKSSGRLNQREKQPTSGSGQKPTNRMKPPQRPGAKPEGQNIDGINSRPKVAPRSKSEEFQKRNKQTRRNEDTSVRKEKLSPKSMRDLKPNAARKTADTGSQSSLLSKGPKSSTKTAKKQDSSSRNVKVSNSTGLLNGDSIGRSKTSIKVFTY